MDNWIGLVVDLDGAARVLAAMINLVSALVRTQIDRRHNEDDQRRGK
ncbi:hypothetical protein OH799_32625 [Nocardia sp. NBC_00881]|nr:hypothetical protein OH799_32625 [Nocardia sp. NBC_00881]